MPKVNVEWEGNLKFTATDEAGHSITMDAPVQAGGENTAPSPLTLVLMSLAGCSSIDIVTILSKMKVKVERFNIEVDGRRAEQHPKIFTDINVFFKFSGEDIPRDKVERAIGLSVEKYCSVAHMLNKACNINYVYEINGTRYQYQRQ
ncbi:putative redox protein [Desulfohalotomaculum tongense]|uniref:OsmC family protein n=1 Tax=Desulforadius tongensis TaxID=1216062 RepID=UPI00195E2D36|nr:OsmC family protein [Desulforadius tongensis]MBM7854858.1 putative redox protein [Desulforadius tongensis]